ncbi:hypothetical protein HJC44_002765 [Escherichia coli]|nr:hypothetical protein [Escherichia coli]
MIDWFTGILPCIHRPLPAGSVVSVDADGAVEWETVKRLTVRGSYESTMKVRSVGSDGEGRATHLYIDGNPSKFLQGHSVIGSDDLQGLVLTAYARILALLHIPHDLSSYRQVMAGQFKISRIDINYMYSLSTLENVRAWLYAAEFKAKTRHGRACGKGGTVYLGKNSRRWSLKFYSKYDEHTSGKKGHQMADEFVKAGLLDWSKGKLRIELTLRTTELFSSCAFAGSELELNKVKLPEAISLIYSEVLKVPYMLDPQLVNDERMITFRLTPDIDEREFVTRYLGNMNIRIWTKKGVDFIAPYTPKEPVKPRYTWTYTPQYRSVAYLSDILGGYVSGSFNNSGAVISDDSLKGSSGASNYINRTGDILVYYGTKEDIAILKTLVTSLDTMSDEVVVSGYVFEVQTSQSDGSGILLAAKILSDKFNISVGAAGLDNFINIRTGSIDAIFNLLKTDSRFTVVSAPRLRVKNNASASFSVGSDVPVLGSVTVNNNTTTQSVEYRSSGVLFNVTPSIKSRTMDLKIQQQLSNFVTTETGVNNSPTLIKRDVTTEVSLADGDIILLGGLAEQKDSKASSGWSVFGSRTSESNKTDIMVMLQVRKVDRSRATPRSAARSGELFRDNLN